MPHFFFRSLTFLIAIFRIGLNSIVLSHQMLIFIYTFLYCHQSNRNEVAECEKREGDETRRKKQSDGIHFEFVFYFISVADGDLIRDKIKNFLLNFMFVPRQT